MRFEMLGQTKSVLNQQVVVREDVISNNETKQNSKNITSKSTIPQKKIVKKYVKDPVLNAILNETTPGLPQTGIDTGIPLPNFSKVGVSQEFIGEMKEILNESNDFKDELVQPNVVDESDTQTVGPDLSKLFNKNFKAILEQSKKGHGGNFSGAIQSW